MSGLHGSCARVHAPQRHKQLVSRVEAPAQRTRRRTAHVCGALKVSAVIKVVCEAGKANPRYANAQACTQRDVKMRRVYDMYMHLRGGKRVELRAQDVYPYV